jgi:hypothetical protein
MHWSLLLIIIHSTTIDRLHRVPNILVMSRQHTAVVGTQVDAFRGQLGLLSVWR